MPSEYEKLEQARLQVEIGRLHLPQPSHRQDPKTDPPVNCIKELGFENLLGMANDAIQSKELVFFIDPQGHDSYNVTDEAVREAIFRFRETAQTLELYLLNKNNCTTDWIDPDKPTHAERWARLGFEMVKYTDAVPRCYVIKCTHCDWRTETLSVQSADTAIKEHLQQSACGRARS